MSASTRTRMLLIGIALLAPIILAATYAPSPCPSPLHSCPNWT